MEDGEPARRSSFGDTRDVRDDAETARCGCGADSSPLRFRRSRSASCWCGAGTSPACATAAAISLAVGGKADGGAGGWSDHRLGSLDRGFALRAECVRCRFP